MLKRVRVWSEVSGSTVTDASARATHLQKSPLLRQRLRHPLIQHAIVVLAQHLHRQRIGLDLRPLSLALIEPVVSAHRA